MLDKRWYKKVYKKVHKYGTWKIDGIVDIIYIKDGCWFIGTSEYICWYIIALVFHIDVQYIALESIIILLVSI